jgi:hypothetical protein
MFSLTDSFCAVERVPDPVFMFRALVLIFDDTEHVFIPFSCFALPNLFLAVTRARDRIFMFFVP